MISDIRTLRESHNTALTVGSGAAIVGSGGVLVAAHGASDSPLGKAHQRASHQAKVWEGMGARAGVFPTIAPSQFSDLNTATHQAANQLRSAMADASIATRVLTGAAKTPIIGAAVAVLALGSAGLGAAANRW